MNQELLRQYLAYYRDLGIDTLYRRGTAPAGRGSESSQRVTEPRPEGAVPTESLAQIRQDIGDCRRCRLHEGRSKIVFGAGSEHAKLVFVGEGPGADEDEQGVPFVGRAGQLLTQMIEAMGFRREEVFIANILKCRPPENRDPRPDEVEACREYLDGQIACIKPRLICTLGRPALQTLVDPKASIAKVHAQVIEQEGLTFVPLYHPAAGLHNKAMQASIIEGFDKLREILERYG